MLNAIGALGPVVTSIAIGVIFQKTGRFDFALYFVGAHGVMAVVGFWVLMPRMEQGVVDE